MPLYLYSRVIKANYHIFGLYTTRTYAQDYSVRK